MSVTQSTYNIAKVTEEEENDDLQKNCSTIASGGTRAEGIPMLNSISVKLPFS
jgi:hypothetical protein